MKKQLQGSMFIVIASLGFGAMGTIATFAYKQGININTLLFFRFSLAAIVLWSVIAIGKVAYRVDLKELLVLLFLGVVGYACMSTLLFKSFQSISPAMAVLVFYTYPISVMILSFLLKLESITKNKIYALLMAGVGLIFVLQTHSGVNLIGIFYSFLAAIIYAAFILISKNLIGSNSLVNSAYISLFTSVALFLNGLLTSQIGIYFSITGWTIILSLAVISTIIPFLSFFEGLKMVGATKASIISIVEPVFAVFLSFLIFGEQMAAFQWFGMTLVLLSSIMVSINLNEIMPKKKIRIMVRDLK